MSSIVEQPGTNKTVRLLVCDGGALRPILWVLVGPDGSVYLGPRMKVGSVEGVGKRPEGRAVRMRYEELRPLADPATLGDFHASFHPTGRINVAKRTWYRNEWKDLSTAHQLCALTFSTPSSFRTITAPRKSDIILEDMIQQDKPLHAKVIVRRLTDKTLIRVPSMTTQRDIVLEYSGLRGIPDLFVHVAVGYGLAGPWPKQSGIVFASTSIPGDLVEES